MYFEFSKITAIFVSLKPDLFVNYSPLKSIHNGKRDF